MSDHDEEIITRDNSEAMVCEDAVFNGEDFSCNACGSEHPCICWQRNDSKKDMCNQCKRGVIHDKGSDCEQTLQEKIEDLLDSYIEEINSEYGQEGISPHKIDTIAEALVRMFEKELQNQKKEIIEKIKNEKVIMWNDDSAQHIRNIQNNETIETIINNI